jgi:hypothetical protein
MSHSSQEANVLLVPAQWSLVRLYILMFRGWFADTRNAWVKKPLYEELKVEKK